MSDSEENDELEQNENVQNISVFRKREKIDGGNDTIIELDSLKKMNHMLTCPICLDIFTDPVYVKGCSHRFCRDCIEKAIRSSKMKQCPTCRKTIGTKRLLRLDRNVQQIIEMIYGDVSKFLADKQLNDNLVLNKYYKDAGLQNQESTTKKKKTKNLTSREQSALDDEDGDIEQAAIAPTRVKRRNIEQNNEDKEALSSQLSEKRKAFYDQELREHEEEKKRDKLKKEADKEEFDKIERLLINMELKVIPYEGNQKQFDMSVCKLDWRLTLADITKLICSKLGINHMKYNPFVKFFAKAKQGDTFYHPLEDKAQRLKTIDDHFWNPTSGYRYVSPYEKEEQVKQLEQDYIHQKAAASRILYYMIEVKELSDFRIE